MISHASPQKVEGAEVKFVGKFSDKSNQPEFGPSQAERLTQWYTETKRELPWRADRDPYRVLVSELMLQQTTVAAVVPLYQRWMEKFPTIDRLAEAASEEVMESWSGLGYYNRATRLHQAAQLLSDRGVYPTSLDGWLALPGFGPYTSAAVASIAFGLPHLALDTNVIRVLYRYFGWQVRADHTPAHKQLRERLEGSLEAHDFGVLNQGLMELGATVCRIRQPLCSSCPLGPECQARRESTAESIPVPRPKPEVRVTHGKAYILGATPKSALLPQGTSVGLLSQLYQPLIDLEGENRSDWPLTPQLERIREDCGSTTLLGSVTHGISGRKLVLEVHRLVSKTLAKELQGAAKQLGHPILEVDREPASGANAALSTLTRKLLKVWRESS